MSNSWSNMFDQEIDETLDAQSSRKRLQNLANDTLAFNKRTCRIMRNPGASKEEVQSLRVDLEKLMAEIIECEQSSEWGEDPADTKMTAVTQQHEVLTEPIIFQLTNKDRLVILKKTYIIKY